MTSAISVNQDEYVGIWQASKQSGRSVQWVQRMALIGRIRTRIEPGEKPKYRLEDIETLAGSKT